MSQLPEIIRTIDRVSADVVAKASTFQAAILADVAGRRGRPASGQDEVFERWQPVVELVERGLEALDVAGLELVGPNGPTVGWRVSGAALLL